MVLVVHFYGLAITILPGYAVLVLRQVRYYANEITIGRRIIDETSDDQKYLSKGADATSSTESSRTRFPVAQSYRQHQHLYLFITGAACQLVVRCTCQPVARSN
ncbi:hypothetical protein F4778DRAFT_744486 [Xylariomycetidae sp. FL2044]|nr:hypothetical protein F4778DRAFT_744486 [Xylariomycetidae sp. FL2044]